MNDTIDKIFEDARQRSSYKRCNYSDYEEFKQRLHAIGIYDKSYELANLLKI